MPDVQITHTTTYGYRRPVGLLAHRLMVRPQDSHDLRLHAATLAVDPPPLTTRWAHDVVGNSVCHLEWPDDLRTDSLSIVSRLALTHYPSGRDVPRATLEPAAEAFPFAYATEELPDIARLAEPQLPDTARIVDSWARRFLAQPGGAATLSLLEAITQAIKADFVYAGRVAEGTQAPTETLALGSGTCRDFALLMMEAVRSLGLAARFVTGYLYDDSTASRGGGATHAWCSVYLPGAGWVEYDPTNGLVAGSNLIRVGVTRTPEQAVPVAGGFIGDPNDPFELIVDVRAETSGIGDAPPELQPSC